VKAGLNAETRRAASVAQLSHVDAVDPYIAAVGRLRQGSDLGAACDASEKAEWVGPGWLARCAPSRNLPRSVQGERRLLFNCTSFSRR